MKSSSKSFKYVFVCGLHRSGTSVLAHNIAKLDNCTGFRNTPPSVPDEGQNLQNVYPFEAEYGGPGRFGFDPRSHLTETSDLLTPDNVSRLHGSWHAYWDKNATIFVEKTPGNLLMTRFLQAAFDNTYFIVVRRHPIAVCMGTPKLGQAVPTSLHRLFAHWLHCHELFEEDKKHLKRVYELTYEDYIVNPNKYHQEIAAFIGTTDPRQPMTEVKLDRSKKYFDEWQRLLTKSFLKEYYRYIAASFEPRFAKYEYSLIDLPTLKNEIFAGGSKIATALGIVGCLGADVYAMALRVLRWPSPKTRRRIKAMLPQTVATKITEIRRRGFAGKERARQLNRVAASTRGRRETGKSA